jgi:pimeloyl-ACP methyl ester carboxylesterase
MVAPLAALGIGSRAVELPSCGPEPTGGLAADSAAVAEVLAADPEPTILLGHSYGGMVITDAAVGQPSVRHLVYVSSMLPWDGESLGALMDTVNKRTGSEPPYWLEMVGDTTLGLRGDLAEPDFRAHFLADCEPALQRGAWQRITRQAAASFVQSPRGCAWQVVPTTAVICADDRATAPERQRIMAERADRVVEIPTGHHPFLSRPDLLAEVIAATQVD